MLGNFEAACSEILILYHEMHGGSK